MKNDYKTEDKNWITPLNLKSTEAKIKIKKLTVDAKIPVRKNKGDAGFDISSSENVVIASKKHAVVSTGFSMAVPRGYEAQVRPRSGLAAKHMVTVLNSPGTIDSGYRGEVKVILINHGESDFKIQKGDRIAQLVFKKVESCSMMVVKELDDTERGEGGLGSTGIK